MKLIYAAALALALLSTPVAAQQQQDQFAQALKAQLGELSFANLSLMVRLQAATDEAAKLRNRVQELEAKLSEREPAK